MHHRLKTTSLILLSALCALCGYSQTSAVRKDLSTTPPTVSDSLQFSGTVDLSPATLTLPGTVTGGLGSFATAAQGTLADTATQPADWDTPAKVETIWSELFLFESDIDTDLKTFALPASTTITAFGASLVDDASNTAARSTLGLGTAATTAATDYEPAGVAAADITDATADGINLITAADANPFADADATKLDGIEALADVTDTANVTAAGALMDSELTNLADVKAYSQADQDAADNRRAFAGGVTFAAAGEMSMAAGANDFSTADFTISIDRLHLDDYTPTTAGELYSTHSAGNNRLQVIIQTNGDWRLTFTDGAAATTNYDITPTTALPDYPVSVAVSADRSGNATIYVDGTANGTVEISAVSAIDIGSGNTNSGELLTDANLSGTASGNAPFNRLLSATEHAELSDIVIEAWLAKYPEDKWGDSGTEDFEDGATISNGEALYGLRTWGSPTVTNYDGVSDADSIGGAQEGDKASKIVTTLNEGMRILQPADDALVRYELYYYSPAGEPNPSLGTAGGAMTQGATVISGDFTTKDAWTKVVFEAITGVGNPGKPLFLVNNGTIYIDSITTTRVGTLAAYPMTEGNGRQLRDLSGRYDALLSATGYQHLKPKAEGYVRVKAADANPSIMMLEDSDIIPADAVWTQIIAEERIVDIANTAQDLADRRVRLADSTGDLIIQRSDGTTHATLGTVTTPTDTDDVDIEVHYKQVIR